MCLPYLPDFDTRNMVFQTKKQLLRVSGYAEKFVQEFWDFFSKSYSWKRSQPLVLPWPSSEGMWAARAAGKRHLPLLGIFLVLAFFKAGAITVLLNLMLAVSANEIWISNQTFPELGSAEMGQVSGCAIGDLETYHYFWKYKPLQPARLLHS